MGIALVYFIVISGWYGYHKSISKHPHLGYLGTIRYGLDLLILFFVYYMVSISKPNAIDQYGMIFLWVIPIIFIVYSIWDILKFFEYRNGEKGVRIPARRLRITLKYGIISILLSVAYYDVNIFSSLDTIEFWQNKTSFDYIFIILYFIHIGLYRYEKREPITSFK
jgi:hypothetical protein